MNKRRSFTLGGRVGERRKSAVGGGRVGERAREGGAWVSCAGGRCAGCGRGQSGLVREKIQKWPPGIGDES